MYYNAVWHDEGAYSVSFENGSDKETITRVVESVDYPTTEDTDNAEIGGTDD